MDRPIILSVFAATVLSLLAFLLLIPPTLDQGTADLPWRIERDAAGRTQVFGLTLGVSTLAQMRARLGEDGEINLFHRPGEIEPYQVEVFFKDIELHQLRADIVATLAVPGTVLSAMYERGLRISQLGSGSKKIRLDPPDIETLLTYPIRTLTYLPRIHLDRALIERRFGCPAERVKEPESEIVHLLYPARGLDIARASDGSVVIQYVNVSDFARIRAPLAGGVPDAPAGDSAP